MKKTVSILLSLLLMMTALLPVQALAEAAEPDLELEGFVTEIVEGGFLMEDAELGLVMLNTDETTVWDGVLIEGELEIGMYVIVQYDGRMTRSLPPQAHADRVGCYIVEGTVSEFLGSGVLVSEDPIFGDVLVNLPEGMPHVYLNVPITVYYDGIMALSLPGRVSARAVIVPMLEGTVSDKTDEGFTLIDAEGTAYEVLYGEETLVTLMEKTDEAEEAPETEADEAVAEEAESEANEIGEAVTEEAESEEKETGEAVTEEESPETDESGEAVAEEAESEANETGEAVTEEAESEEKETGEAVTEEAESEEKEIGEAVTEEAESEANETGEAVAFGDGDQVAVYYNGIMTRSLPPQVTALEIVVTR